MTRLQHFLLGFLTLSSILHIIRYFSPESWVRWGMSLDRPWWATWCGNSPVYECFSLTMHPIVPLIVFCLSALLVFFMYDIESFYVNMKRTVKSQEGFTLVESMIVIAIISILAAVVIYNFDRSRYRHRAAVSELRGMTQLARMEAIKSNINCYIGINSDGYSLYRGGEKIQTGHWPPQLVVHGTLPSGKLGDFNVPNVVPSEIIDACNDEGVPMQDCQALTNWINSFNGEEEYDHILGFNSRGMSVFNHGGVIHTDMRGTHRITLRMNLTGHVKVDTVEML